MLHPKVNPSNSLFPTCFQQNPKACVFGTGILIVALAAIGLAIAQGTGKIDMIKFGKTKTGVITFSLIGGVSTIGLVALGLNYKNLDLLGKSKNLRNQNDANHLPDQFPQLIKKGTMDDPLGTSNFDGENSNYLKVRRMKETEIELYFYPNTTILELRKKLANDTNVTLDRIILSYRSQRLDDGYNFEHYNINDKTGSIVIIMLLKLLPEQDN